MIYPLAECLTSPIEIECSINSLRLSISAIKEIILKCIDERLKRLFVYELEIGQGYPKLGTFLKVYHSGFRDLILKFIKD